VAGRVVLDFIGAKAEDHKSKAAVSKKLESAAVS
jgi:hypothetical protein